MTPAQPTTLQDLARAIIETAPAGRSVVAIAGAPGSGKSTLAEQLMRLLDEGQNGRAAVLPMDGFHYDDRILIERGLRPRKGAPETFDVGGLVHMLSRLRRNDEDEVAVPVFDRDLEIARAGARMIPRQVRYLIIEGNYLLFDRAPWSELRAMFDVTVTLDVAEEVLRGRLVRRWQGYGLTPAEIEAKVEGNDLPNGRSIRLHSATGDFILKG